MFGFANIINGNFGGGNDNTLHYNFVDSMKESEEENSVGACGYTRNYKSAFINVYVATTVTLGYSAGTGASSWTMGLSVPGTWAHIKCCMYGSDMDACDFSIEAPLCARYVNRRAR